VGSVLKESYNTLSKYTFSGPGILNITSGDSCGKPDILADVTGRTHLIYS